jgi:hypothetical protein
MKNLKYNLHFNQKTIFMAKKYLKDAAARARASRKNQSLCASLLEQKNTEPEPEIDPSLDWECGYTGGVGVEEESDSDSDYEPDSESEWSDDESLLEYEGDELEENLRQQRELMEDIQVLSGSHPSGYEEITVPKLRKEWTKVEGNRGLGYSGHSKRTQRRRAKEARDRARVSRLHTPLYQ